MSFSVTVPTNSEAHGSPSKPCRNSAGFVNGVPSGSNPDASMGASASMSTVRHWPTASKFSSANPSGSILAWQAAQVGLARCCSSRCRTVAASMPSSFSISAGMSGGGGGGGDPSRFSSSHFPRTTGDVRFGCEVTVRMLPCPSRPARRSSGYATRR